MQLQNTKTDKNRQSPRDIKTHAYINATGYYVPEGRVSNSHFATLHSKPEEWFVQRTGIMTRSRANDKETIDYMSLRAVENAVRTVPFPIGEVDLIVQASYSPDDTVGTTAHRIQREFGIEKAKVFYVSSACSSALNAIEIIRSFFETGIATKALLIAGDRNSTYSDDNDPQHGHLWGDGVTAYFLSTQRYNDGDMEIVDIETRGLGHIGAGPEGVLLKPRTVVSECPTEGMFSIRRASTWRNTRARYSTATGWMWRRSTGS